MIRIVIMAVAIDEAGNRQVIEIESEVEACGRSGRDVSGWHEHGDFTFTETEAFDAYPEYKEK